ncbi:MAG: hypothetical protein ACHQZS_02215 [Candidatus Binatales bacterium]
MKAPTPAITLNGVPLLSTLPVSLVLQPFLSVIGMMAAVSIPTSPKLIGPGETSRHDSPGVGAGLGVAATVGVGVGAEVGTAVGVSVDAGVGVGVEA